MARCFDCFHCDACKMINSAAFPSISEIQIMAVMSRENSCKHFKHTADVVEIKHGQWIKELDETHYCSNCGKEATYTFDGTEICGVVCPYCMTVMDR